MRIQEYTHPAVLAHPSQKACGTWFRRSWSGPLASETNNTASLGGKVSARTALQRVKGEHSDNIRDFSGDVIMAVQSTFPVVCKLYRVMDWTPCSTLRTMLESLRVMQQRGKRMH